MTLIKDLIQIPEKVQRGDFVLNLSQGLEAEAIHQTLAQYVVTPQLAKAFDDALGFIKSTVVGSHNSQKGAYLHGSFGSGKSHFMAVLHLLLQGNPEARAISELGPAVARHDEWLQQHNILLLPFHMIGAPSIEAGILGGYVRYIKKLHPEAPQPGFYLSDRLFRDASGMREKLGDVKFFDVLNQGNTGGGLDMGWGDLASGWDAVNFDAVLNGQADEDEKARLVGDLVGTLFQSVADMANSQAGGYVDFDEGLRIMSRHAKSLGYDAVVLFLDELILWLASHIADKEFIANNIQKVVKLVEPSEVRELPVASFIARQRDLREFVGEQYTGSDQVVLSDSLKYWDGRFHTITLEDRNLPVIAQRRLLKPRDDTARQQIQAAFDNIDKSLRDEVHNLLLTSQGDREMFRSLYPFSPVLIQALIALSSALQRERTALKVMLMLLVEQRETLELGGVIPVGDLYDVIATEAEPFSEQMRGHFDNAKQLFERKLIPLLEQEHGTTYSDVLAMPVDAQKRKAFNNDLRLLKSLLLAALVPEVESFKQLTANKLAALNHGTIKSPIPGQEARTVLGKCRKWAGQVGEIKIGEDANPTIAIQLSGVDTESILEQAQIHDNDGARRKLVKDMVLDAFGIQDDNQLFIEHRLLWRGTWRHVELVFQNIRDIADFNTFEARGDDWKVIIDFPFDVGNHSPADGRARIQEYEARGGSTRTLCWLPYFLSQTAQKDLGVLVRLEYLLKSDDRFNSFSKHLSPVDRASARNLLENQRSQLRQRLKDCLLGAYGGSETTPGMLDDVVVIEDQVMSLEQGFSPRLPHGANLRQAFEQLVDQALRFQYPDHPEFDAEVRPADVGKVFGELRKAIHASNGRIDVDSPLRPLMRSIAQPLGLGEMHERHFILKSDWPQQLRRELAKDDQRDAPVTVARLRAAMDRPRPKGLTEVVQNLLIMVFAEHGQYAYLHHGKEYDATLKDLPDNLTLVKQELAEPDAWKQGIDKAGAIFGLTPNRLRTANHQNELVRAVHEEARALLPSAESLLEQLRQQLRQLDQPLTGKRIRTADAAVELLSELSRQDGTDLVHKLATTQSPSSDQALGKSLRTAQDVTSLLKNNNWALLSKVWNAGSPQGSAIKQRVVEALNADELAKSLGPVLLQAQHEVTELIDPTPAPEPAKPSPQPEPPAPGYKVVKRDAHQGLSRQQAKQLFTELEAELQEGQSIDVSYIISSTEHGVQ